MGTGQMLVRSQFFLKNKKFSVTMLYVMLGSQGVPEINSELLLKELGL
jgi:hypothetical protein